MSSKIENGRSSNLAIEIGREVVPKRYHLLVSQLIELGPNIHRRDSYGYCNICGRMSAFTEGGVEQPRPFAKCLLCGSLERHRFTWEYIQQRQLINSKTRVLHFAPPPSIEARFRETGVEYISTDLSLDEVDVQADITDLPFDDGSFDLVICSHVLEHVPDDRSAIKELHRVLSPEGSSSELDALLNRLRNGERLEEEELSHLQNELEDALRSSGDEISVSISRE